MDNAPTPPPGNWQAELDNVFGTIEKEDQAFTDNLGRQTDFYKNTALPALQAAAQALGKHGRTAEAGQEPERVYLIVNKLTSEVEFQYAVVAEVRIEAVTPYIHCWFEENKLAEAIQKEQGQPEKSAGDEDDKGDEAKDDDGEGDDKKDDKEPARTKTIEVLSTWREGRALDSITQEEILHDFVRHYQEALGLARTQLHVAPPAPRQQP
ncbi:hypothetical protein HHL22_15375 [Hymenobacter sp. RP-2-7]|uniref:Uncharacterized protein n=1 Tax=Hymenobacter polaris TaxID=2682546 RepID=A0A7Y0AFU3_9BACT|nr:hypothetical protein [Hymenobacter polaris]NML66588.1 hypothetical protein [Hymenobacter polaris]